MAEKERLEKELLEFIEKTTKEPKSETETKIVPDLARVLLKLWKL